MDSLETVLCGDPRLAPLESELEKEWPLWAGVCPAAVLRDLSDLCV